MRMVVLFRKFNYVIQHIQNFSQAYLGLGSKIITTFAS